jgi:DNA topoisomerase VI subunit B
MGVKTNPRKLRPNEIVKLVQAMKKFEDFLQPDATCLSPLGEDLLRTGIMKELEPEFVAVTTRRPAAYSGHPFIVETAIAYGGRVQKKGDINLYRFANKIPLIYDESGDVCWKVVKSINWRSYGVTSDMAIAVVVHLCSTKVPYKTVGKEIIADRPDVYKEILNGVREVSRHMKRYLARRERVKRQKRRLNVFSKYLPKIAEFSGKLGEMNIMPDVKKLFRRKTIFKDFVTSNEYVQSEMFHSESYKTLLIHIHNKHETNSVRISATASVNSGWKQLIKESILNPGAEFYEMFKAEIKLLRLEVRSESKDKHGIVDAFIDGLTE